MIQRNRRILTGSWIIHADHGKFKFFNQKLIKLIILGKQIFQRSCKNHKRHRLIFIRVQHPGLDYIFLSVNLGRDLHLLESDFFQLQIFTIIFYIVNMRLRCFFVSVKIRIACNGINNTGLLINLKSFINFTRFNQRFH